MADPCPKQGWKKVWGKFF